MIEHSPTPSQTKKIGASWVRQLSAPTMVSLVGEIGAGKTTFVQGMAEGLGIDPTAYVNSPTFTLVNEYRGAGCRLIHVDLYRIERPEEVIHLALEEYGQEIVVIEWGDRLPNPLKKMLDFEVLFEIDSPTTRRITIKKLTKV